MGEVELPAGDAGRLGGERQQVLAVLQFLMEILQARAPDRPASATRPASFSAVKETATATSSERLTRHGLYVASIFRFRRTAALGRKNDDFRRRPEGLGSHSADVRGAKGPRPGGPRAPRGGECAAPPRPPFPSVAAVRAARFAILGGLTACAAPKRAGVTPKCCKN